jgi:pimeloyl-ACP methyl ester carboxylesterase
MRPSRSEHVRIRGVDHHVRGWGDAHAPVLVLLHGSQDVSASWQFVVDALEHDWRVVAPDWRGHGLSGRSGADTYWFPDYVADLDALLERVTPEAPARLVGHSMGGQVSALYAGVRPDRVARLVNVEGFGPPGGRQDPAPRRFAKWLAQLGDDALQRPYGSFDEFALRMRSENPRLDEARSRFLAGQWGEPAPDGTVVRRADPALKRTSPIAMPQDDVIDCWRQTRAAVLWIDGAQSGLWARLASDPGVFEARAGAYADLRIEHVEDAGRNVHHDQPERLARLIEAFVR